LHAAKEGGQGEVVPAGEVDADLLSHLHVKVLDETVLGIVRGGAIGNAETERLDHPERTLRVCRISSVQALGGRNIDG
jgi:hypothetical protein